MPGGVCRAAGAEDQAAAAASCWPHWRRRRQRRQWWPVLARVASGRGRGQGARRGELHGMARTSRRVLDSDTPCFRPGVASGRVMAAYFFSLCYVMKLRGGCWLCDETSRRVLTQSGPVRTLFEKAGWP